nr:ADP-ribosylglycohydrolase family protein [uncultured Pseudogulbenkiania sp.]
MRQLITGLPAPWQAAVDAALVGDAFGVPHEFKIGGNVPHKGELAMVMPASYPKTYEHIPYGTWSDDGSQMLALLDVLLSREGRFSKEAFGANLLAWRYEARFQSGGIVFDCGMQTRVALDALAHGNAFQVDESHCGNGSLMRVLPVAALPDAYGVSQRDALLVAMAQSDLTHPQRLARVCCALYVELAWLAHDGTRGLRALLPEAAKVLITHGVLTTAEQSVLADILAFGARNMPTNSGYVVNSLWSALWAIDRSDSLSDTLRNVVCLGGDTDTVACIAGGLASLVFGWDVTAREWEEQMWQRVGE